MRGVLRSIMVSFWFMALTFPLLVIKIGPEGEVLWRWNNMLLIGAGIFVLSFVWRGMLVLKGVSTPEEADLVWLFDLLAVPRFRDAAFGFLFLAGGLLPLGLTLPDLVARLSGAELSLLPFFVGLGCAVVGVFFAWASFMGRRRQAWQAVRGRGQRLGDPGLPRYLALGLLLALLFCLPWAVDIYRVNVLASTFIWIMLGLGLNIVVGQAGLLVLGYVAFYAVGAYTYAICNIHFGGEYLGFWALLPVGGFFAAIAGILLCLPVLRLRGDYLAIVTLGFGEIVRVTLEGGSLSLSPLAAIWSLFTDAAAPAWMTASLNLGGPSGIGNIPYPGFFGIKLGMDDSIRLVYFVALGMAVLTIVAVTRLRNSRVGRSWIALREDEIACEAMGIDKSGAKLSAFALGACWAGFGGVLFAAKTTFINPSSFTFMESALILSVVVLGGMGSILGVALGAAILILLPEYLRSFNEYRMLIFGACMVLMMAFRPQGLITPRKIKRVIRGVNDGSAPGGPELEEGWKP